MADSGRTLPPGGSSDDATLTPATIWQIVATASTARAGNNNMFPSTLLPVWAQRTLRSRTVAYVLRQMQ